MGDGRLRRASDGCCGGKFMRVDRDGDVGRALWRERGWGRDKDTKDLGARFLHIGVVSRWG
jgi:hypothetical protein